MCHHITTELHRTNAQFPHSFFQAWICQCQFLFAFRSFFVSSTI
jgi:hypothetical protein